MPTETVAAAIIAGGRARRFSGRDKSRLVVRGRPIIVRQVEILQRLADEIVIVAGDAERFADLRLPVHADVVDGAGALGGLLTALTVTTADAVLAVASDQPFLHEGLLGALVERSRGRDGAWVATTRGVEPLLACYRRTALPGLRAAVAAGDLQASRLDRRLDLGALGESELAAFGPLDELLANINTPEDFARIE